MKWKMEREKTSETKADSSKRSTILTNLCQTDGHVRERELILLESEMKEGVITTDLIDMKKDYKGII